MLAVLLSLVFGVRVYDSGSTIKVDTISAVMTMSELRLATTKLADYAILRDVVTEQEQRHVADSTALTTLEQAYQLQVRAGDSLKKAFGTSDSSRQSCVLTAAALEKSSRMKFHAGIAVGATAGLVLSVLTFFAGVVVGN